MAGRMLLIHARGATRIGALLARVGAIIIIELSDPRVNVELRRASIWSLHFARDNSHWRLKFIPLRALGDSPQRVIIIIASASAAAFGKSEIFAEFFSTREREQARAWCAFP